MINWFRKQRKKREARAEAQHRRDQLRRSAVTRPASPDAPFASLAPHEPDDGVAARFATVLIEQAERQDQQPGAHSHSITGSHSHSFSHSHDTGSHSHSFSHSHDTGSHSHSFSHSHDTGSYDSGSSASTGSDW